MQYQTTLFRRLRGRSMAVLAVVTMLLIQALIAPPAQAVPHPQYTAHFNGNVREGSESTCASDGTGHPYGNGVPQSHWSIDALLSPLLDSNVSWLGARLRLCGTQGYEASPLPSAVETCRARGVGSINLAVSNGTVRTLHVDHVEIEAPAVITADTPWMTGQAVWRGTWHDDDGATGTLHGTTLLSHNQYIQVEGLCGWTYCGGYCDNYNYITGTLTIIDD